MASKTDLINETARRVNEDGLSISKKDMHTIVNATFDALTSYLEQGENVQLIGFGSFNVRERKERIGRNPQNGEDLHIPAHNVVVFKAGGNLKAAVK